MMRRLGVLAFLVITAGLLVAAGVLSSGPASAHSELSGSSPSAGAHLSSCPHQVSLIFSEGIAVGGLTVTAGATPLSVSPAGSSATEFTAITDGKCAGGSLALGWHTVSADDGHVATGSVTWSVDAATTAPAPVAPTTAANRGWSHSQGAAILFRSLGYFALAGFAGGLAFLVLVWRDGVGVRRVRLLLIGSVVLGFGAAVGDLWIAAERTSGTFDLLTVLKQPFGREYVGLALIWLLAAVPTVDLLQRGAQALSRVGWRLSAGLVASALVYLDGTTAHAVQSKTPQWGALSDYVHVLAMSIWVGGLLMLVLGVLPRRKYEELAVVVPRFSKVAQVTVALVVLSGLTLVLEVIVPLPRFWGSHYSDVLGIKLLVLAAAMSAAMFSKRWVARTLHGSARRAPSVRAIGMSVAFEAVLALTVLGAAGMLVSSSPGL